MADLEGQLGAVALPLYSVTGLIPPVGNPAPLSVQYKSITEGL